MPLRLAETSLSSPVLLAPMAGITDRPFRDLVMGFGAGLVVSEMVASQEMVQAKPGVRERAELGADVENTAVQIAGREAHWMAEAARQLADRGARIIDINMKSHIWVARHLVPKMIERGGGYFLNTASAAGLLSQVGSMPYAVTKHAAVAIGEWLAFTYGDQGIRVTMLCPQAVRSKMTAGHEEGVASMDGMLEPEDAAEACVQAIREERFLALPHAEVLGYMRNKTENYDRWIGGMKKLNRIYGGTVDGK